MFRVSVSFRGLRPLSSWLVLTLCATSIWTSKAHATSFSGNPVPKNEWTKSAVPSYIDMYIALPDTMPEKPPILVNIHSCGNSAGGQWSYDGFAPLKAAMDSVGFIMILPQQSRNCWNVGAPESLTHDGGGDTGAIVQMVQYALEKYNGDPTRVYVMGGSGGGMCTQALLAVYPEIFKAGHERAGVPAGCWAEGYEDGMQWSGTCAAGSVNKTGQEWGDYVRAINPSFNGPRPRIQLNHGNADETINFNNFGEAIEQWTNVLGLEATPTSTDMGFQGTAKTSTSGPVTYDRQFWQDDCGFTVMEAWEALGQKHGMGYESEAILKWFGLDEKRDQDPWDAECGGSTAPGQGTEGSGTGSDDSTIGATAAPTSAPTSNTGSSQTLPNPDASGGVVGPAGSDAATSTAAVPTSGGIAAPTTSVPTSTQPVATSTATVTSSSPGATTSTASGPAVTSTSGITSGVPTVSDDADSEEGCSVGVRNTGVGVPLALVGLGLVLRRRRRGA